jgi:hypothetical protein
MRISSYKAIKFPTVFAVSLGLGLGPVAGLPVAAAAAPPVSVVAALTEPPDRAAQLRKALLAETDLPSGYRSLDLGVFQETVTAMLRQAPSAGADPCAMTGEMPDIAAGPSVMPVRPVGPAVTVKTVEPVKTGPAEPATAEGDEPDGPPTVLALFERADERSLALEVLSAVGEKRAGESIAAFRTMLEKCPSLDLDGADLKIRALDWQQRLGDDSIAVELVLHAKAAGMETTMRIRAVQVAYRDVSVTMGLMGADDPKDKRLKKVARAAVRKLVTTSSISTEEAR